VWLGRKKIRAESMRFRQARFHTTNLGESKPERRRRTTNGARSEESALSKLCPNVSLQGLQARIVVVPPRNSEKMWSAEFLG
jgi:hypothetical protein